VPKGFLIASASEVRRQHRREQARGQREVDQRVRVIAADQLADLGWPDDVGGLVAEHLDDGVAGGWRHRGVFVQLAGDVLTEVPG